jgi:hypothetical protein
MKTIVTALALLGLFAGLTDRPQRVETDPNQPVIIDDGFAAKPRIIVIDGVKEQIYEAFYQTKNTGGKKEKEK